MPGALRLRHAHIDALRLRPYQETCLGPCLDTLKGGSTKIGISLPISRSFWDGYRRCPETLRRLVFLSTALNWRYRRRIRHGKSFPTRL